MADIKNEGEEGTAKQGNVLAGFVLYRDANMDWPRFIHSLREDWGIEVQDPVKDNALVFHTEGMVVACSLMPGPVPDREAEENARNNIFWKDGSVEAAKHRAHVMLAVMNKFDAMEQAQLFAKVAYSLLKLKNAIGIYKNPTVYEKRFYMDIAEGMKKGDLPVPIMIYLGAYVTKEAKYCAYTSGMTFFGKKEIEVVDSLKQADEVINFMCAIAEYVLLENVELKDGETIGFTEEQKLPISVGDGVSVKGTTVKIGF